MLKKTKAWVLLSLGFTATFFRHGSRTGACERERDARPQRMLYF